MSNPYLVLRIEYLQTIMKELVDRLESLSEQIHRLEAEAAALRHPVLPSSRSFEWVLSFQWRYTDYESEAFSFLNNTWKIHFGVNDYGDYGIVLSTRPLYREHSLQHHTHDKEVSLRRSTVYDLSCCFRIINRSNNNIYEKIFVHQVQPSTSIFGIRSFIRRDRVRRCLHQDPVDPDRATLTLSIHLSVLRQYSNL